MKEKFNPTKKVQLRGGFSDRNDINKINTEIQLTDFDERTRNKLYNAFINIINYIRPTRNTVEKLYELLYENVLSNVYCQIVETGYYEKSAAISHCVQYVKETFLYDSYDAVLTIIEYVCVWTKNIITDRAYIDHIKVGNSLKPIYFNEKEYFNSIFEGEFVGYRFVGDYIVAICDDVETKEIEQSLDIKFNGCKTHIKNALGLLSDRNKPDYKNSIKESISAVESICCVIAKKEHATLGEALKILENKHDLNGQLKTAFDKLYSYTNDEGGIRHSNYLFESNVTFEEAKFMLVSCCAFVNYLISEYGKIEG